MTTKTFFDTLSIAKAIIAAGGTRRGAARLAAADPSDAKAIEAAAICVPEDEREANLRAFARVHDLTVRDEGIVPQGEFWQICDGCEWAEYRQIPLTASAKDAVGSVDPAEWHAPDPRKGSIYWDITARLACVSWRGWAEPVSESRFETVHPKAPECAKGHQHEWSEHFERGHGAGMVFTNFCRWCGEIQMVDTYATNREDGTQGHTSIWYEPPTATSRAIVDEQADEDFRVGFAYLPEALEVAGGDVIYTAPETGKRYIVSRGDVADLGLRRRRHHEDAYSAWCAETQADEVEEAEEDAAE